jgi:16S rRNA (guanine(966)-N(2))-methyltransferase RsmD
MTKLRIISGGLKGRYVAVGEGVDFRPTQERVRESVSEIIKRRIRGAAAADLCAGSGAMGFEMVSRGAARVEFVEANGRIADRIADNAVNLGVNDRVRVVREDVSRFVDNCAGRYDIIYYDPPYDDPKLQTLVPKLRTLLTDRGILIYERRRRHNEKKAVDTDGKADMTDARIYSDTVVEFYGKEEAGAYADGALSGDV